MEAALDIYIKLLIAIISFIAPLLIHLLSVFSDGIAIKKRRWEEYELQSSSLFKVKMNNHGSNVMDLAEKSSTEFNRLKVEKNKQLKLLDPKPQIKFLFPMFFGSLFSIILYRIICDTSMTDYPNTWIALKAVFLLTSIIVTILGVTRLYHVAIAIIDVKGEIAQYNEEEKQQSKGNKITT